MKKEQSMTPSRIRLLIKGAAAACAIGLLAACGTSGGSPSSSPASSGTTGVIQQMISHLKNAQNSPYSVTYSMSGASAGVGSFTYEQSPPKYRLSLSTVSVIATGSTIYLCTGSTAGTICTVDTGTNPLTSVEKAFSASSVIPKLTSLQSELAAKTAGVHITSSTQTFASQPSTCLAYVQAGVTSKYCATDSGVLAYASDGSSTLTLTHYSPTVAATDFALPQGASLESLPATIP